MQRQGHRQNNLCNQFFQDSYMISTYALDENFILMGDGLPRTVQVKGHLEVLVKPPKKKKNKVLKWETELCPLVNAKTFGEADTGSWIYLEDNRSVDLYTLDGNTYTLDTDHEGQSYNGLGPIPDWLTKTKPEIEPKEPTIEEIHALRQAAYTYESDPLKLEAEYDALINNTEPDYTAWIAKVQEIKERYPLPNSDE